MRTILIAVSLLSLPAFTFAQPANSSLGLTDRATGVGQEVEVSVLLSHDYESGVAGWSYGVCHPTESLLLESAVLGSDAATANGGAAPGWSNVTMHAGGWTSGVVISLQWMYTLPPGTDFEVGRATYTALELGEFDLCTCSTLGAPLVGQFVAVPGYSYPASPGCGTVSVTLQPHHEFIRGDSNLDGAINIGDPVTLLDYLFGDAECPCSLSSDTNADGSLNIADAIAQLGFLFAAGAEPPAPFAECGMTDSGGCVVASPCP